MKSLTSNCFLCKDGFNISDDKICQEIIHTSTSIVEEEKPTTFITEIISDINVNSDTNVNSVTDVSSDTNVNSDTKDNSDTNDTTNDTNDNKDTDDTNDSNDTILINGCKLIDIIKGICEIKELSNENFQILYSYLKNDILGKDYNKENLIVQTEEVILQLSTLEQQKDSSSFISSVDLKECEKILRDKYKIKDEDYLIILKTDIKSQDSLTYFVEYETYDPYSFKQMNLSYCKNSEITINVPVNLDNETISLYESLSKSGYNLFDSNDSFYNDICTPYTSDNNTDIILTDRKNILFKNNGDKVLCQNGCNLKEYNSENKKAVCDCSIEVEEKINEFDIKNVNNKFTKKELAAMTFTNSNFLVMRCGKLIFNIKNIFKNIGMIIMSIIFIISIILIIIHYIKERKKINNFIQAILKIKFFQLNFDKKNHIVLKTKIIKKENQKKMEKIKKIKKCQIAKKVKLF